MFNRTIYTWAHRPAPTIWSIPVKSRRPPGRFLRFPWGKLCTRAFGPKLMGLGSILTTYRSPQRFGSVIQHLVQSTSTQRSLFLGRPHLVGVAYTNFRSVPHPAATTSTTTLRFRRTPLPYRPTLFPLEERFMRAFRRCPLTELTGARTPSSPWQELRSRP